MIKKTSLAVLLSLVLIAGCGDDDDDSAGTAGTAGAAGSEQTAGASGSGDQGGAGGTDAAGSGGSAGTDAAGAGGTDAAGTGGGAGTGTAGTGGGAGSGNQCSSVSDSLLTPVDKVSTGEVKVLSDAGGVKTVYVDASAGGTQDAPNNPRVYLSLGTGGRVELTDKQAPTATSWDLALKRPVLFTNSGDGGPGQGGAVQVAKTFDAVTKADAPATIPAESFFSQDCIPNVDQTGVVITSFADWYNYNETTHQLSPKDVTYVVKGADGTLYKVGIVGYYAKPDGTLTGTSGGRYVLKIAAL